MPCCIDRARDEIAQAHAFLDTLRFTYNGPDGSLPKRLSFALMGLVCEGAAALKRSSDAEV